MTKRTLVTLYCLVLAGFGAGAGLEIHHLFDRQRNGTLILSPTGLTMLINAENTGYGSGTVLPYLDGLGAADLGLVHDQGIGALLPSTAAYTDCASAARQRPGRLEATMWSWKTGEMPMVSGKSSLNCQSSGCWPPGGADFFNNPPRAIRSSEKWGFRSGTEEENHSEKEDSNETCCGPRFYFWCCILP